jgi:hypothetical protein
VYWNGQKRGLEIFREVVRRLYQRFDHLQWMKLSEIARYWAARELTRMEVSGDGIRFDAPFACPMFTVRFNALPSGAVRWQGGTAELELREVGRAADLRSGCWRRVPGGGELCVDLPKGTSRLEWKA